MTKNEALKAALDGETIVVPGYRKITWNGSWFEYEGGALVHVARLPGNGWSIVPAKYRCESHCCIKNRDGNCIETDIMAIFARGCQINIKQVTGQ